MAPLRSSQTDDTPAACGRERQLQLRPGLEVGALQAAARELRHDEEPREQLRGRERGGS